MSAPLSAHRLLFSRLWADYLRITPSAARVHSALTGRKEVVQNDHIALRTVDDSRVNIAKIATIFEELGYEKRGTYIFDKKKLEALHLEHTKDSEAPLVFISQLQTEKFSDKLQTSLKKCVDTIPTKILTDMGKSPELLFLKNTPWEDTLNYETYCSLAKETEYASWLYAMGYTPNHFTVSLHKLSPALSSIKDFNAFLKSEKHTLNSSGGEVKGSPELRLEQSSIMADQIEKKFVDGTHKISSCYYEFAKRYPLDPKVPDKLYQGFVVDSADKIFESTNMSV